MNYDRTDIPAGYDRGRDHGPEMLQVWMNVLAAHLEGRAPTRILDLGCGTGRFSDALAVSFDSEVIGLDPSRKMLDQAQHKQYRGRVRLVLGRGEALPLRSNSIDVIFTSMTFHHFTDRKLVASECRRVLRDQGRVFVRTGTREQIPSYPYYPFFPASHSIMYEVLPDGSTIRDVFEAAGFSLATWDIVTQTIAPGWAAYADKLAAGADSVLARLSPQDFDAGIAAVRNHGAFNDEPIIEPIDLFVFTGARD
jgi:ubiquinone/menaquinone biosynthesis C-methylase UbiE